METVCPMCADKAHEVETIIEERSYGDYFGAFITGRLFHHLHHDGRRKTCRQNLPEWLFTLSSIENLDRFRKVIATLLAKSGGNTKILPFLM
jgi:hypothetical protein